MKKGFRAAVSAVLSIFVSMAVTAQEPDASYPSKPVHIIVPYGAGGSTDVITRILAQKLSQLLGQPVIVENRPGANGIIGTEVVAKAAPDGYTLLAESNGQTVNVSLYKSLPFDMAKDLVPVAGVASMPNVLAVHPSEPFHTLDDLLRMAKAHPGRLVYGHAGVGSSQHLSGELLKLMAGVDLRQIAYKGGGPAVTDALGDHVPIVVAGLPAIVQHVKAGQMRALAVTGPKRSAQLPDVPTVAELGFPGFNQVFWIAFVAPRGVAPAIVARLNTEVNKALAMPDVLAALAAQGAEPTPGSVEQLAKFLREETDTAAGVIEKAHINVDN